MSILDRLNRLVRSNLNDATGGSDERSFRTALDEMENSLREARRQQAEMRRNERELIDSIRTARDEADEWEERAMLALQNDDEALARKALKVKNEKLARADDLREELRDHRSHMEDIQASLEALETKLQSQRERISGDRRGSSSRDRRARKWDRKLEGRRGGSSSEHSSSGGSEAPTEYDETFRTDETFETFDRMAGKIDAMEAEIEAMRELSGEPGDSKRARLERIFRKMENRAASDRSRRAADRSDERDDRGDERDDLGDMKRRMERLSELKDKFGGEGSGDSE